MSKQKTASKEQIRNLDCIAIEEYQIPGIILMENAGIGATNIILSDVASQKSVAIFCGKGNNGGDGFVVARHLYNNFITPHIFFLGDTKKIPIDSDAGINFHIVHKMGIEIFEITNLDSLHFYEDIYRNSDYIVDAIFGTGLCRNISSPIYEIIKEINSLDKTIFALDTPSGLDCDSGEVLGIAIQANKTITFALAKNGFYLKNGPTLTGEIDVVPISVPRDIIETL